MLAFYFTQMELSVIEISRMRRRVEKVAGLWAGHGEMCRLPMPGSTLPPVAASPAVEARRDPATGLL